VFAGAVVAHELEEHRQIAQNLFEAPEGKRADFMFEVRFSGDGTELRAASLYGLATYEVQRLWADVMVATLKSGGALMIACIAWPSWKESGEDEWTYCTVRRPQWMHE
jgi:hypothetical protein